MKKLQNVFEGSAYESQVASLSEKQLRNLNFGQNRLMPGHFFVVLPQIVHSVPVDVNGTTQNSRRVAVVEFSANLDLIGCNYLTLSSLKSRYYGKGSEIPVVPTELRDGLARPVRGTSQITQWEGASFPIVGKELNGDNVAVVTDAFAVHVTGYAKYHAPKFIDLGNGKYDMETNEDGTLALESTTALPFGEQVTDSKIMNTLLKQTSWDIIDERLRQYAI